MRAGIFIGSTNNLRRIVFTGDYCAAEVLRIRSRKNPKNGFLKLFFLPYILFCRLPIINPVMTQASMMQTGIKVGSRTIGAIKRATRPIKR